MGRARWEVVTAALTALLLLWTWPARAQEPSPGPTTFERLDAFLEQAASEAAIPGLSVVVVVGGEIAYTKSLGVADGSGRPITADTPFVLASVSKAFTAACVMQLREAGALDLDAPVQRYLPWFRVADEQASAQITLRQLLHHTAGLPHLWPPDDADAGALERYVRSFDRAQLIGVPGDRHFYTDAAYEVLALIVQTVSGMPYDEYLAQHIFGPLGMTHSHALAADAHADGAAEGYYSWFGAATLPTRVPQERAKAGSATTFSSANDMGRWLIAHMNGGRLGPAQILSAEGIATLHAPAVATDPSHGYAMGWDVRPLWEALDPAPGVPTTAYHLPALVEHGGRAANGHTYVGFVPDRGWGFAMLMNINDVTAESRYMHTEQGILAILSGADPPVARIYEGPLILYGKQIAMALLVLELVSLLWVLDRMRRWRRPQPARSTWMRRALAMAVPLLLDLLVIYLFLVVAPATLGAPLDIVLHYTPDLPYVIWPSLALAAVWGPIRTLLMVLSVPRTRPLAI